MSPARRCLPIAKDAPMDAERFNRRGLLIGGFMVGSAGGAAAVPPIAEPGGFRFFTETERAFIEPAIDRLIPADPHGPSASQANVHVFLDRQLAGPFGRGDHFYLGGPWPKGAPEQGYQSRLSPAQLYRTTIPAIERHVREGFRGMKFIQLSAERQDDVLKDLESGKAVLADADGQLFFTMFLQNVLEGYFSDPIYGGNKDMAAWKMIGFPGAHYDYREWAQRYGERVPFPPGGIMGRP